MSGLSILERLAQRGLLLLVDSVCDHWNVTREELLGADRHQRIVSARKHLYVELRARGLSYPDIGYLVGRDHTTVLMGVRSACAGGNRYVKKARPKPFELELARSMSAAMRGAR